jgi:hypothetical protein
MSSEPHIADAESAFFVLVVKAGHVEIKQGSATVIIEDRLTAIDID